MDDRLEDARTLAAAAIETFRERGDPGHTSAPLQQIETLQPTMSRRRSTCRSPITSSSTHGLPAFAASAAAMRARALCWLGRYSEAEQLAKNGRDLAHASDAFTQACWAAGSRRSFTRRAATSTGSRSRALVRRSSTPSRPTRPGHRPMPSPSRDGSRSRRAPRGCPRHLAGSTRSLRAQGIIPLARRTRERLAALQAPRA